MTLEQIGNTIVFHAFFVSNKQGKTGLTVTVDVYRNATQIVTAGAAVEVGGGVYRYSLADISVNAEGEYVAIFKTADGTVDVQHVPHLFTVGRAGIEHLDRNLSEFPVVLSEEALEAGAISCRRGDTVIFSLTGLGSLANRSKLYFTVKTDPTKTDAQATLQIEESGGLLRLKGAASTSANATLVVDDLNAGDITITIKAAASKELPYSRMYYDVQIVRSSGTPVSTLAEGLFIVSPDITMAVT